MNCKLGDLAFYAGFAIEAHGQIVRVVRLRGMAVRGHAGDIGPHWVVDPPIRHSGCTWPSVADAALRPIRDQDGEDETLEWAGKPQEQPCNAL